ARRLVLGADLNCSEIEALAGPQSASSQTRIAMASVLRLWASPVSAPAQCFRCRRAERRWLLRLASSDAGSSRALRAECEIGSCHLPACKTILDVVGDLFANVCQVEEFFLDYGIFGLFSKLSIRGRLLPEIVVPLHTYLPRKDPQTSGGAAEDHLHQSLPPAMDGLSNLSKRKTWPA